MKHVEKICIICGAHYIGAKHSKYCCEECRRIGIQRSRAKKKKSKQKEIITPVTVAEVVCPTCGILFLPRNKGQRFCCRLCYLDSLNGVKYDTSYAAEYNAFHKKWARCGRYEYVTIDATLKRLKKSGESFADHQKKKTMESIPKIDVAAFMEGLKK